MPAVGSFQRMRGRLRLYPAPGAGVSGYLAGADRRTFWDTLGLPGVHQSADSGAVRIPGDDDG